LPLRFSTILSDLDVSVLSGPERTPLILIPADRNVAAVLLARWDLVGYVPSL
jgi:hypothetical protein